jgi:hypothetical protein
MVREEFAKVCQNGGIMIRKIDGRYFLKQGWKSYSFPLLSDTQINNDFINTIRFRSLFSIIKTNSRIKNTYEFILSTNNYSLDNFARKIRNRIRKSLQNCTFRRPAIQDLLVSGLKINRETLKRQSRDDKVLSNSVCWEKYIKSFYFTENVIILGAYYQERMVGYIIALELEEKYIIQHAFIDKTDSELTAPMNGLIFTLVNQLIGEKGHIKISYGLDSIKDLPDLNRFKMNMLFEKIPSTRVYIINPFILPFIRFMLFIVFNVMKQHKTSNMFIRELIHIYHGNRLLSKELTRINKAKNKANPTR